MVLALASRTDRPRAAASPQRAGVQATTASSRCTRPRCRRTTCSGCGSIATRSAIPACGERSHSRSIDRTSSSGSYSAPARSATTRRSGRSTHPPTRRLTSASRTSSLPTRCSRPRQGKPQVHDHDPQPGRRPGLRGGRSSGRTTGGNHDRPRDHDLRRLLADGAGDYNNTPWINRPATITEYGARGAPNLYLTAAYMSNGQWNASQYKNPAFDSEARTYLGSAEIAAQRKATKKLAGILLRDTPVITAYFLNYVTASSSKVLELPGRRDLAHPPREDVPRVEETAGGRSSAPAASTTAARWPVTYSSASALRSSRSCS